MGKLRSFTFGVFTMLLLKACASFPLETRSEVNELQPKSTYTVDLSVDEIIERWRKEVTNLCMVDARPTTKVVEFPVEGFKEIQVRYSLSSAYYGIIRIEPVSGSQSRVFVYDWGALRCIQEKYIPFLDSL